MIGPAARRILFWGMDAIRNGIVKEHYEDISAKNESDSFSTEQLEKLLEHAKKTVPFYRNQDYLNINEFPILTKKDFKEDYDAFKSHAFLNSTTHEMSTSGSTGTPFIIQQDINKRKRTVAELIYFNHIAGQKLGDRYMYIKAFLKPKSFMERIKQNVIPVEILRFDKSVLEEIRLTLKKDKSIGSILAYSSSYEILANYLYDLQDKPDMFNLKALFSSSAVLTDDTKDKLVKVFGCPVIDRYSNQENGVLAQTKETYGNFYINRASYYIELLKISGDESAAKGEPGRIVITDLYNFAMPMIRYDTGDLAVSDDDNRNNLKTLRNIQGRRVDIIFDTEGSMMTPHTWSVHMRKYNQLKQWQFIQEDKKKYILKVNGAEGIYSKDDFDNTLRSILGSDAEIDIQYVDEIPVLASGKFKNTICNYKPDHQESL
ncbi:MAG TPA: hypothetical protein DIW17_19780 [Clostridiales bacterium]|nr:hypothetical protein [Clostridiales bacterium]